MLTVDVSADDTLLIRNSADGAVMKIKFSTIVAALSSAFDDIVVDTINKVTITQPATGATLTIPNGTTLNTGTGGTLGSAAFTAAAAYADAPTIVDWTPTDVSGGSLTFGGSTEAIYFKIGRLVFVSGRIEYPVTADTHNAAFSLPFAVGSSAVGKFNAQGVIVTGGTAIKMQGGYNSASAFLYASGNTNAKNAGQSGQLVDFSMCYIGP